MSDSNTHLQRTVVRLPKSPNHHYYPYWHANWTPNYTCLHPPHVLEFFSRPLVFLELFMFLPPDVAPIQYSYIYYYNHLPLLVYHYHFWLVSHHQWVLLYLEVPQDLSSTPTRMVETNHFDHFDQNRNSISEGRKWSSYSLWQWIHLWACCVLDLSAVFDTVDLIYYKD